MLYSDALKIEKGLTALIGGGGKTSLMYALGRELSERGSVILATSTRIMPPPHLVTLSGASKGDIASALRALNPICVGEPDESGKLHAPSLPFSVLRELADYVIVEADGSRMLPLKAHLPTEPVIPAECRNTVLVLGLGGIGQPIARAAHRPELYSRLAGASVEDIVTEEISVRVILAEGLHDRAYLNQTDVPGGREKAEKLAGLLNCPAVSGSLKRGGEICLY